MEVKVCFADNLNFRCGCANGCFHGFHKKVATDRHWPYTVQ